MPAVTARKLQDPSISYQHSMRIVLRAHLPPPLRFRFQEDKALQVAALLVRLAGGALERRGLSHLLYLVDRESLRRFSAPVMGGTYASARGGPVIQDAHDLILEAEDLGPEAVWSRHLRADGARIILHADPGDGALSEADEVIVREVAATQADPRALPEWEAPTHGHLLIKAERILSLLGKPQREIDEIAWENSYFNAVDDQLPGR